MSVPNAAGAPALMAPEIQDILETSLVFKEISSPLNFSGILQKGKSIDIPDVPDAVVVDYNQGTNMAFTAYEAVSDVINIDISRAANFTVGKNELAQLADKNYRAKMSMRHAYRLSCDTDQKGLLTGVTLAGQSYSFGTPNSSTIFRQLSEVDALLSRADCDTSYFAVLPPEHVSLLAQFEAASGFNSADSAIRNGYVGASSSGFHIYKSNNLPTTVVYTMDTINTAAKTFTIAGVTFTFVASGTAAAAGEISIGANVAANKTNFLAAINGTGTPGATTYIELSVANRRKLTNAGVSASAFSGDDTTITGFGRLSASTNSADGGNAVGTEVGNILLGGKGKLRHVMQRMPEVDTAVETLRPQETNISISTLYGLGVLSRDEDCLIAGTFNFA